MSWLYSQALVEEYLAATCSDGEPYAQLNGNPTPQAYCAPDKMTDFSRLSRFGMTYKPLMESHGKELLTWYLEAFHARISQSQGGGAALKPNEAACGVKWHASFVKYDPDMSSWKTHQCSLLGGLDEFLETWPKWGLMRNGECWERQTLAQTIKGTESGLWPTPTVCGNYNRKGASKTSGDGLATAVAKWPTPTAHNAKETNSPSEALRNEPTLAYRVGGKLNPTWVEWLMGWPLEWTDLKPLGMDKYHFVPQPLGES
jgi:hypothetical protein